MRISRSGRRFRILQATVWNLVSETGEPQGQAALFADWKLL
ncbi:MAG TPA: MEKHLA domain-containing protein [Verrucomicrobiae bacterium]|nr:MEKHLA domain-containing protein [Verrucomicrobiae bacterium]